MFIFIIGRLETTRAQVLPTRAMFTLYCNNNILRTNEVNTYEQQANYRKIRIFHDFINPFRDKI